MTFYFAKHYFEVMEILFGIKIEGGAVKVEDLIKGTENKSNVQNLVM
jgi:hypothetical protein